MNKIKLNLDEYLELLDENKRLRKKEADSCQKLDGVLKGRTVQLIDDEYIYNSVFGKNIKVRSGCTLYSKHDSVKHLIGLNKELNTKFQDLNKEYIKLEKRTWFDLLLNRKNK